MTKIISLKGPGATTYTPITVKPRGRSLKSVSLLLKVELLISRNN
jgi:hypothetical protein